MLNLGSGTVCPDATRFTRPCASHGRWRQESPIAFGAWKKPSLCYTEAMPNPIFINFHGAINEPVVTKLMAICAEIVSKFNPPELYFLFSSPGGSVDSGIAIYNFLRALPCPVTMHNTGAIDSIATVIFHSADTRYASPHSSFGFHGVTWNFEAKQSLNLNQINEVRSGLAESENKIARIISGRCSLSEEDLRGLFLQGETKNASFALEKGIVQEIREAKIPQGAQFFSFNLN